MKVGAWVEMKKEDNRVCVWVCVSVCVCDKEGNHTIHPSC